MSENMQTCELGEITPTERGFELVEFMDLYGVECNLQQSSLADYEQPGVSAVWLGCAKNAPPHLGNEMSPRMHLNRNQVEELVAVLARWLDTGSFARESRVEPPQLDPAPMLESEKIEKNARELEEAEMKRGEPDPTAFLAGVVYEVGAAICRLLESERLTDAESKTVFDETMRRYRDFRCAR